jgi:hypothetical protein
MMNIQLLTGILLLSCLTGTKAMDKGKGKSSIPDQKKQVYSGKVSEREWPIFHSGSGGLEEIFGGGSSQQMPELDQSGHRQDLTTKNEMVGYGTIGSAASPNAPQAQPTIGQLLKNFAQSIDDIEFEDHHNIVGAQRSGKQPQQQLLDFGIEGKMKAKELEMQQQEEQRVRRPRIWNRYQDSMAEEFTHITKSEKGDHFALCTACNTDIKLESKGIRAIIKHLRTLKHEEAVKVNMMESGTMHELIQNIAGKNILLSYRHF